MALGTNRGGPNPFGVINQMVNSGKKIAQPTKTISNAGASVQKAQPKTTMQKIINQPKKVIQTLTNPKNYGISMIGSEPKQQVNNTDTVISILMDFQADVNKTTDLNKLADAYPELPRNIIGDLYSDFKKPGATYEKIKQAYPELGAIRPKVELEQGASGSKFDAVDNGETNIFGLPKLPRFENFSDGSEETTVDGVLKNFGANVVKSGWNLASDVINFVADPVDSAKALGQLGAGVGTNIYETITDKKVAGRWGEQGDKASAVGQFFVDRYGNMNNISKTAYTDPLGMFSDAVSVIGGGAWAGGKIATTTSKLSQASKLNQLSKAGNILEDIGKTMMKYDPADAITNGTYKGTVYMTRKIGDLGTEPAKIVKAVVQKSLNDKSKKMGNRGSSIKSPGFMDNVYKKASGLTEYEIQSIQSNPYLKDYWIDAKKIIDELGIPEKPQQLISQPLKSLVSDLETKMNEKINLLSDSGPLYNELKKIKTGIELGDITKNSEFIDNTINKYRLKVNEEGTIVSNGSSLTDTEINAINRIVKRINETPVTDVEGILNIRKLVSKESRFDLGVSTEGQNAMKTIRKVVDDIAKQSVPKLKEVDNIYSKQIKELQKLKEGIFYKEKARATELRDNIVSIIKNVNGENRSKLRDRLLEIMPDLETRVDAINMIPKLAKLNNDIPKIGNTFKTIIGSTGGGILLGQIFGNGAVGAIVGAIGGYFGNYFLQKLRAKGLSNVLSNLSPEGLDKLSEIGKKIEDNKALQQADIEFMQQLKRDILREQEKYNQKPALPYKPMELTQEGVIRMGGKPITPNTALGSLKKQVIELPPARTLKKYNIPQPESLEDLKYFVETKRKSQELTEKIKSIVDENNMLDELGQERVQQLTEWNKKTQSELTSLLDKGELSKTDIEELISFKEKNIKLQETVHNEIEKVFGMEKAYEKAPLDMVEVEQLTIKQLKDKMNEKARINVHEKIGDERAENAYVHANKTNSEIKQLYKDGKLTKQDIEDIILARQSNKMDDYLDRGIASSSESELSLSNFLDEITPKSLIQEARKYKSADDFIDNNIADIYGDKFFHGSTINIPEIKVLNQGGELGQGFYITNNATLAKDFVEKQLGKQKLVVNKIGMKGVKMKFMTKRDYVSEVRKYNNSEDFRKDIINEGYDGIWSPDTNQGVIFPEKVKKLKTETQLKKIREEANTAGKKELGPLSSKPEVKAQSLLDEARKYKSAEDMINGLEKDGKILYHGGNKQIDQFDLSKSKIGDAVFISKDRGFSDVYAGKRGGVTKIVLDNDAKIIDFSNKSQYDNFIKEVEKKYPGLARNLERESIREGLSKKDYRFIESEKFGIKEALKEFGYDGYTVFEEGLPGYEKITENIGIINTNKIKTESQLRKIREEANKK